MFIANKIKSSIPLILLISLAGWGYTVLRNSRIEEKQEEELPSRVMFEGTVSYRSLGGTREYQSPPTLFLDRVAWTTLGGYSGFFNEIFLKGNIDRSYSGKHVQVIGAMTKREIDEAWKHRYFTLYVDTVYIITDN